MKEAEDHKANIQKMTNEGQRQSQNIRGLEKDISELKRELKSRDEAIAEREKKIADQKRHAIELEKNR